MASMLPPLRADLRKASHMGRHGDTMLAHINSREAELLKMLGGAGSHNPRTGLPEFFGREGGGTGPGTNGQGSAHDDTGSHGNAGGMSHAEQARIISPQGYGAPVPGGPTISRGLAPHSPRPGSQDRWGYYRDGEEAPAQAQDHQLYNDAANNLQSRGFGGWLKDHLLDLVPGFHQVTPDPNLPGTYKGGIYHDAWNPVSAVVGLASPYGSGLITSKIAQAATDALHTPEYTFGGAGWGPTTSPAPTAPGVPASADQMANAPGSNAPGSPGGGTRGGSLLPQIAGNPAAAHLPAPAAPPVALGGSILPPITAAQTAGYTTPIPGPSPYSVTVPAWRRYAA